MIDFGYSINTDRQIDYDANDHRMSHFILSREPSYNLCIGCGSCTATCSAGNFTDFNFRKLHLMIKRGEISEIKTKIQKCMFCGKCLLVCPRGVNTRNLILTINCAIDELKL